MTICLGRGAARRSCPGKAYGYDPLIRTRLAAKLPYNLRTRSRLILTDSPTSVASGTHLARRVAKSKTSLTNESNFNCTRGPSGHASPCRVRKVAVLEFNRAYGDSLYLNLIAGHGAIGRKSARYRTRDRVKIGKGRLLVRRYNGGNFPFGS